MKGFISKLITQLCLVWEKPFNAFIISLCVYGVFAGLKYPILKPSVYPYYNYLADAFLHGQLSLRLLPALTHDLVFFNGQYFLYWPPMPAIMLMPFVLIFGVGFSDVAFTVVLAAVNVALVSVLLRALDKNGIVEITPVRRGILTSFFALGTVHLILAVNGRVWFTAQLIGLSFILLAYLFSVKSQGQTAFLLTGTMLGLALLTRNNLLFVGIWPAYYLLNKYRQAGTKRLIQFSLAGLMPVFLAVGGYLLYNQLRFGNPFELGLDYHQMDPIFESSYLQYGAFNIHYLPTNFYYQYIHYPFPFHEDTTMGGSLFLLSPLLFVIFPALIKGKPRLSILALFLSILITNIPILLLMGTGYVQIGPRYTLDFMAPLLIITAFGMTLFKERTAVLLNLLSIAHYTYGLFMPL